MRRTLLVGLVGLSLVLLLAVWAQWPASPGNTTFLLAAGAADPATAQTVKLPGARLAIRAEEFPTLQAAFNALPESGGLVELPAGRFEIDTPLLVETGDVLIRGQGAATLIVNTNQQGQPALVVRPRDLAVKPKSTLWRVQLADFRLEGNPSSGTGIEAQHVDEIFLHGLSVSRHGGDGIRLDHCYEDPRICNSLVTYNKQSGLELLGCHDIVVSGNQFEENRDAVRCLDGYNLCLTGNCVDDHLRHGVVIENTYGSVVSGNMIEECQGSGILLDRDCYGITLSANVIAHEFSGGIELLDAHGCTVTGNSFPIVWKRAVVVGAASDRITITGNTFGDTWIGQGQTKRPVDKEPASGIVLETTREVAISGNLFAGLATPAVSNMPASAADSAAANASANPTGLPVSQRVLFGNNVVIGLAAESQPWADSQVSDNLQTPALPPASPPSK